MKIIITGIIIFSFPVLLLAGIDTLLYEVNIGECAVKTSHDAVPGENGTLVLRTRLSNGTACDLGEEQLDQVLDKTLSEYVSRNDLATITSVFLGRLISYGWLSKYLVDKSMDNDEWNRVTGSPVEGSSNAYVNNLLYMNDVISGLAETLGKYNYELIGVACEKVLINEEKLPYDAMCWLVIK